MEDFVELDRIFTDCFPKEINKAKIKEIFEILQSQVRPDLVNEMKSLILLKTPRENGTKLEEEKNNALSSINQVLPTEMLKKILEKLNIESLCLAKQTCMHWRNIIHEFDLVKKASSKFL